MARPRATRDRESMAMRRNPRVVGLRIALRPPSPHPLYTSRDTRLGRRITSELETGGWYEAVDNGCMERLPAGLSSRVLFRLGYHPSPKNGEYGTNAVHPAPSTRALGTPYDGPANKSCTRRGRKAYTDARRLTQNRCRWGFTDAAGNTGSCRGLCLKIASD